MVSKASEDFPEPRTRIDSCSGRTFEAAWVISLVAKGKPRQRVSRSLPKLQIIRPLSKRGKPRCCGGRTTPEFRVEFDKVWWGFLSVSDSVLCCQTGGTR